MVKKYGNFVDGNWILGDEFFDVENKYSKEIIAKVSIADEELVEKAIKNSKETFDNHKLSVAERHRILMKASELMAEAKEEFALIISQETGKTITDARSEVVRGINTFVASAEESKQIMGEVLPIDAMEGNEGKMAFTIREPLGVVCAITPFNFPLNLTAHKVAPAIAAGNTILLKPAEKTPISSLKLAEILYEAGLPKGYLNVVNGYGSDIGDILLKNKDIALYTFTGSPQVGEIIKKKSGLRKVVLELGNNSPNIIHHDVKDLDQAINQVVTNGYSNSGQACISVQRVYVHKEIFSEVIEKAKEIAEKYVLGDPLEDSTDLGPLISEDEAKRAESWIDQAVENGAEVVTGGRRDGAFLKPTILINVKENMRVMCEEVFAPVISFVPYEDIEDAFRKVNDSEFGLQTGIFTSNIHIAMAAAKTLQFGGVNINNVSTFRADTLPYGGIKNSGIGKEGPRSTILEMTNDKLVTMHL